MLLLTFTKMISEDKSRVVCGVREGRGTNTKMKWSMSNHVLLFNGINDLQDYALCDNATNVGCSSSGVNDNSLDDDDLDDALSDNRTSVGCSSSVNDYLFSGVSPIVSDSAEVSCVSRALVVSSEFFISATQKGNKKIIHRGYGYVKHKTTSKAQHFKCEKYKTCRGRLLLDLSLTTIINEKLAHHNHEPINSAHREAKKISRELAAHNKYAKLQQLVAQMHSSVTGHGVLPNDEKFRRQIAYYKSKNRPHDPKTQQDISDVSIVTPSGEEFLLYDNKATPRVLIFATYKNIGRLMSCGEWSMDGTFRCVPNMFMQLVTIMGRAYGRYFPFIYALCGNKCQNVYDIIWKQVKIAASKEGCTINDNPVIHIDYEAALVNAFQNNFPNGIIVHCLFHLVQSIYRRVCRFGFKTRYEEDTHFRTLIRMHVALAFLPLHEVSEAFDELTGPLQCPEFSEYFECTYIRGKVIRNIDGVEYQKKVLYPPCHWNCHDTFANELNRTNNAQEAFHHVLNMVAGRDHLGFNEFISLLLTLNTKNEHNVASHIAHGVRVPKKSRAVIEAQTNITNLMRSYDSEVMSRDDFLFGIQHNIAIN